MVNIGGPVRDQLRRAGRIVGWAAVPSASVAGSLALS